eukprot:m.484789 g.484789  ORF g.484789 m.484789 type:complete len:1024 (+) comp57204_c0_seq7:3448-6519(+)
MQSARSARILWSRTSSAVSKGGASSCWTCSSVSVAAACRRAVRTVSAWARKAARSMGIALSAALLVRRSFRANYGQSAACDLSWIMAGGQFCVAMSNTERLPACFDPLKGQLSADTCFDFFLHNIHQHIANHSLPSLLVIQPELNIIESCIDDVFEQLPCVLRNSILTEAQHLEAVRRIPYAVVDIALKTLLDYRSRASTYDARQVFSSAVNEARARNAFAVELASTTKADVLYRTMSELLYRAATQPDAPDASTLGFNMVGKKHWILSNEKQVTQDVKALIAEMPTLVPAKTFQTNLVSFHDMVKQQRQERVLHEDDPNGTFQPSQSTAHGTEDDCSPSEDQHAGEQDDTPLSDSDDEKDTPAPQQVQSHTRLPVDHLDGPQSRVSFLDQRKSDATEELDEDMIPIKFVATKALDVLARTKADSVAILDEQLHHDTSRSKEDFLGIRQSMDSHRHVVTEDDPDPILQACALPISSRPPPASNPLATSQASKPGTRYLKSQLRQPNAALVAFESEVHADLKHRVKHAKFQDFPQPDLLPISLPSRQIVFMSNCRVADRIPKSVIAISTAELLFNELDENLDDGLIRQLDAPLFVAENMREVYTHMKRAMRDDLMMFEPPASDRALIIQPTTNPDDLLGVANSKRINEEITLSGDRVMLNQHLVQTTLRSAPSSAPSSFDVRTRLATRTIVEPWIPEWRTMINPRDFLATLNARDLDFLCVVFGQYPATLMLTDEELFMVKANEAKLRVEKEATMKRLSMAQAKLTEKTQFEKGLWNVNTIGQEGLGAHQEISVFASNDTVTDTLLFRHVDLKNVTDLHARLNNIWLKLQVPALERMNLAIKYSSKSFLESALSTTLEENVTGLGKLNHTLTIWETVAECILAREECLKRLEVFERVASDPARHFSKGDPGMAQARLTESRDRSKLHRELKGLTATTDAALKQLLRICNDRVLFKGRDYSEKMLYDRVEMLHWLQQERRQNQLSLTTSLPPLRAPALEATATQEILLASTFTLPKILLEQNVTS